MAGDRVTAWAMRRPVQRCRRAGRGRGRRRPGGCSAGCDGAARSGHAVRLPPRPDSGRANGGRFVLRLRRPPRRPAESSLRPGCVEPEGLDLWASIGHSDGCSFGLFRVVVVRQLQLPPSGSNEQRVETSQLGHVPVQTGRSENLFSFGGSLGRTADSSLPRGIVGGPLACVRGSAG